MKLLGHESMATLQRYVVVAARETHAAASQNARYGIICVRLPCSGANDGGNHL
jgi:hypothetical protein